uniref:HipA domain-containing protein n=1 Tax=Enterocloster clostridioformis TaxID=1531 RepID=UPI001C3D7E33|nr:HipA domain-containing protein [Enterocloster clostridioformis]
MVETIQTYTLMHREIPVAGIRLDSATASVSAVGEVFNLAHVPVGIPVKKGKIDRAALNEWWRGRAIPASRAGLRHALEELHINSPQALLEKCLGLSLSDQYWLCPADKQVSWHEVNFFENPFSEDMGNILFGHPSSSEAVSLMSPDNTSDGWLKKKWAIIDGKRCLLKGGSGATQQEPYNEVLASRIMERLHIPHVPYTLTVQEDYPYSVCEDFITPDTELVTAWYIMQTQPKPNHVSVYQHYLNCCETLGILDVKDSIDRMLVLDYLIANEDRHQNNFGAVRNAGTLKWAGCAPIYDSGTSLWFDKPWTMISAHAKAPSKPFKTIHDEQIKLVSSFDWLELTALTGIDEELRELVKGSLFIDTARTDALCAALRGRVERLAQVMDERRSFYPVDDHTADVEEDVAYSGEELEC